MGVQYYTGKERKREREGKREKLTLYGKIWKVVGN